MATRGATLQERPSRRRLIARMGALLLMAAVVGYLAVGAYVVLRLTYPVRHVPTTSPAAYGLPYEDVRIRARDGLMLAGWYIPAPTPGPPERGAAPLQGGLGGQAKRAVVLVHGKDSCRSCEFDGRFVEFAAQLQARGFHILMIDLRGHGESQKSRFTLGEHERWDVLGAVDWLQERGFSQIGVLGVSLGAASAVEAAADPQGGDAIRALVLDSGFGDLWELLQIHFPRESGLPNAFLPGSLLMARLLLRMDLSAIRPVDNLPNIEAPVMLIFGAQDDTVPLSQFHAMAAARPDAETWLVPDAGHARIYNAHPQEYVARVSRFFAETLR